MVQPAQFGAGLYPVLIGEQLTEAQERLKRLSSKPGPAAFTGCCCVLRASMPADGEAAGNGVHVLVKRGS